MPPACPPPPRAAAGQWGAEEWAEEEWPEEALPAEDGPDYWDDSNWAPEQNTWDDADSSWWEGDWPTTANRIPKYTPSSGRIPKYTASIPKYTPAIGSKSSSDHWKIPQGHKAPTIEELDDEEMLDVEFDDEDDEAEEAARLAAEAAMWKRQKGKGKGKGKNRDKGKGKSRGKGQRDQPPPEKFGATWEEPREDIGFQLIGEMAPPDVAWEYPLVDESRRSFCGYLPGMLSEEQCADFFDRIHDGTDWYQPEGKNGPMPRKTVWLVSKPCHCKYKYGSFEVEPQVFPPWMVELMSTVMPLCGFKKRSQWPNSCNVNLYEDGGMSVGWHSDDEALFQGKFRDVQILSLSFGQLRKFELRLNHPERGEKKETCLMLGNGDLATMEGMTQKHMQHRVPREDQSMGPRINLTWRWVVKHNPRCPAGRLRQ